MRSQAAVTGISIRLGFAEANGFVRYTDLDTNRETESRRVDTRGQVIRLSIDRECNHCDDEHNTNELIRKF